ncbi:hypothetical protein [Rossellomorea marisflavi]|uniref:hypothetical protein n=1 Tax=Rossellomorea marisflavi TaxID=189381 RepID=UPI00295F0E36|nr:hypothetical protein [Rossellomorea marisflavi]
MIIIINGAFFLLPLLMEMGFWRVMNVTGIVPFRCRRLLSCGEGGKPPRACGVSPLFSAGVKRLPLQYTLRFLYGG